MERNDATYSNKLKKVFGANFNVSFCCQQVDGNGSNGDEHAKPYELVGYNIFNV